MEYVSDQEKREVRFRCVELALDFAREVPGEESILDMAFQIEDYLENGRPVAIKD